MLCLISLKAGGGALWQLRTSWGPLVVLAFQLHVPKCRWMSVRWHFRCPAPRGLRHKDAATFPSHLCVYKSVCVYVCGCPFSCRFVCVCLYVGFWFCLCACRSLLSFKLWFMLTPPENPLAKSPVPLKPLYQCEPPSRNRNGLHLVRTRHNGQVKYGQQTRGNPHIRDLISGVGWRTAVTGLVYWKRVLGRIFRAPFFRNYKFKRAVF